MLVHSLIEFEDFAHHEEEGMVAGSPTGQEATARALCLLGEARVGRKLCSYDGNSLQ